MNLRFLIILICCTGYFIDNAYAQNPIIKHLYTADPSPIVYKGKVFLYTGHDTARVSDTNYKMPDWHVFSSKDMVTWKDHGAVLSPTVFSWAIGEAYAGQCIQKGNKFYWFVPTRHKPDAQSRGGFAIGVAVSNSPTGPFKDAIGKALIVNEMTTDMKYGWDDIDPTVFIDDDGQGYLYWGNGSLKTVKLKKNIIELDGPIATSKPKGFIEGPWVYKRDKQYYLIYAGVGTKPEMIEYCMASGPEGPWIYKGIIQGNVPKSFTTHPGIVDFKGKSYFFYHNGMLPDGGNYRRSVCVDYLNYNADGTIQPIIQTAEGILPVK